MRLRVARKGDAAEVGFFNALVEDRSTAGSSYVEYLCQVRERGLSPPACLPVCLQTRTHWEFQPL